MSPREKALEIYNKMDWFTNGYVGSSMLSNTEFDDQKIKNTKAAAMVVINEVAHLGGLTSGQINFWQCVHEELNNL